MYRGVRGCEALHYYYLGKLLVSDILGFKEASIGESIAISGIYVVH